MLTYFENGYFVINSFGYSGTCGTCVGSRETGMQAAVIVSCLFPQLDQCSLGCVNSGSDKPLCNIAPCPRAVALLAYSEIIQVVNLTVNAVLPELVFCESLLNNS